MTFPTPYPVGHHVFTGIGQDDLGNDIETWANPVTVNVIDYYASLLETLAGHTSQVDSDIDMHTPPDLTVSVRDRFTLPGYAKPFEVVAFIDCCHGFHGWQPGNLVKLKATSG